jgi:hypothetical protein
MLVGLASIGLLSSACTTADAPSAATRPVAAAAAKPAAAQAPATKVAKTENPADTVCRRMNLTGSTIPQRICHTRDEWAQFDRNAKEGSDQLAAERRDFNADGRGE